MEKMANTNMDILDLQGLGTYDTKIKTEIAKKADDFVPIEYSEWLELTDAQKNEHNWKLLHVPDSGPEPSDVPDGKTVTPTDDVQILLACAGITDKSYTTLTELFADTTTLASVIADNNAIDYLKRSTTFATVKVPKMTSDNTPSGVAFASSYATSRNPYLAFDKDNSTSWLANGLTNEAVGYEFEKAVVVNKVDFSIYSADSQYIVSTSVKIQGSNDNFVSDINDLDTFTNTAGVSNNSRTFNNTTAYKSYRVLFSEKNWQGNSSVIMLASLQFSGNGFTDNATAMSYIGLNNYASNTLLGDATWRSAICNSTYWQSVLNLYNPIMTDDTTPSGQAVASSVYDNTHKAYHAFDNDTTSYWASQENVHGTQRVGYVFPSAVTIYKATIRAMAQEWTFEHGSNHTSIGTVTPTASTTEYEILFNGVSDTEFHVSTNNTNSYAYVRDLRFYGRADV